MGSKIKVFFFLFLTIFCIGFATCSDDNNDSGYSKQIAGDYKGEVEVLIVEENSTFPNVTINITSSEEDKVTLKLAKSEFPILSEDVICELSVNVSGNKFILPGGTTTSVNGKLLPVKMLGTIEKNILSLTINFGDLAYPESLIVAEFEGKK